MQVRFIRMAAVAVLLSIAAAGCGKYSISNIRSLKAFKDANTLYRKADYRAAIERYEASVSFNPDLGFAYFFLGNSYDMLYKPTRKGEPENDANLPKAVENYRIAIEKLGASEDPQEREILKRSYEFLIAAYGSDKLDDFSKAEPVAREMIAVEPDNPANYQALGGLYERQERFDEAEAEFKKAIDVSPSDPYGYQMLAGYYNRLGQFEKTMEAFNARAEMEPNNPEAWHTMATFYQDNTSRNKSLSRAKQLEYITKGIEADDRALSLNPDYFEALTYKNILLRMAANLERNPAEQKRMIEEADRLRNRALEIQSQQQAATAEAAKAAGSGS
jgi:tetratricopeptide (TPR) repeat protein